jgi:glutamate synthase domain-containing protein 2
MSKRECQVCGHTVEEDKWKKLPKKWSCPVCESEKSYFSLMDESTKTEIPTLVEESVAETSDIGELRRVTDEIENYMNDIHKMAEKGESIIEPMRAKRKDNYWDSLIIKGGQLVKIPLNKEIKVNTKTMIGPKAKHPLVIETPIYVTHMSFGALSKEAKIALAKGSAAVKTAMCSGEGGILKESMDSSYKYIFEYVPNQYSVNDENLKQVDAIEIKFGQSAKPGMGGHLPGSKVTKEISEIRGFPEGSDIISPAHFKDIKNKEELKEKIEWLRKKSDGKPIGIKIAAGNIEEDLEIAIFAKPDFITIDGRYGATAAAPKYVKIATSIPTVFALYRARKFLNEKSIKDISLIITGGLRVSSDFAKALALGADAIAIGTAALIACGCQQYRMCNTGKCPVGITTQDPKLRALIDINKSAKGVEKFLRVSTEELKDFARLTGNRDIHKLSISDLCTTNSEISNHTKIKHV